SLDHSVGPAAAVALLLWPLDHSVGPAAAAALLLWPLDHSVARSCSPAPLAVGSILLVVVVAAALPLLVDRRLRRVPGALAQMHCLQHARCYERLSAAHRSERGTLWRGTRATLHSSPLGTWWLCAQRSQTPSAQPTDDGSCRQASASTHQRHSTTRHR